MIETTLEELSKDFPARRDAAAKYLLSLPDFQPTNESEREQVAAVRVWLDHPNHVRTVERAAWLTGLSPAHAEECQVVTPPEPDSHPTPSSRPTPAPQPTPSLHPPAALARQVVHYTPGQEYRDHVDYFSSADARVRERMGAPPCRSQGPPCRSQGPPRAAEAHQGPPRAAKGALHMLPQCQRMARLAPALGEPRPIRLASGPRWSCRLHRPCLPRRRGGQPGRVGARLPRLRGAGRRDAVHLPRAARDAHAMRRAALAQLRPEGRARPAHAALRPPRARWRKVGDEHLVSPAATHAVASGGRATAGPMDGPATHADDALSRGHRVDIIT